MPKMLSGGTVQEQVTDGLKVKKENLGRGKGGVQVHISPPRFSFAKKTSWPIHLFKMILSFERPVFPT
jgi:hypothetical protein